MSAYAKHQSPKGGLNLIELNKVLRAVGFAKFHGRLKEGKLPKPPSVPKKVAPTTGSNRGAAEAGSAKAQLQAAIQKNQGDSQRHSRESLRASITADWDVGSAMPPQPPTTHLSSDATLQRLLSSTPSATNSSQTTKPTESSAERLERLVLKKPVRQGTEDSYHVSKSCDVYVHALAAHRCYRILSYRDTPDGRVVFDILSGTEYFCRSGPQKRRITPSAAAFLSKGDALSEKFPPGEGRISMPRILCRFDCWGRCQKRLGGGGSSAVYEYVKFLGIVNFLDAPSTISKKHAERPIHPNMYPMADKPLPLRRPVDRRIKVDKAFDITPWAKGVAMRC